MGSQTMRGQRLEVQLRLREVGDSGFQASQRCRVALLDKELSRKSGVKHLRGSKLGAGCAFCCKGAQTQGLQAPPHGKLSITGGAFPITIIKYGPILTKV